MPKSYNSFDDVVFDVQLEVPQVSTEAALRALRFALREFCIDSESWVEEIDKTIDEDVLSYDLTETYDADVHRLKSVKLRQLSSSEIFDNICPLRTEKYSLVEDYQLTFKESKDLTAYDGGTLRTKVVFRPRLNSGNAPVRIIERCAPGVIAKAVQGLFMQVGKPWSNPELASYWLQKYNSEITAALANVSMNYTDENEGFSA
ncbi:MAG: hypothetical protein A2020_12125 [Lentisphaerae bacterium GWF2_45_14]|nr:MAG: hypothetical protein A2020_12125 [Lentisphaerae bacterium GWF2_45_14]